MPGGCYSPKRFKIHTFDYNFVPWWPVFPLRKLYTDQMFVFLRIKRMQLRNHADTQPEKGSQR